MWLIFWRALRDGVALFAIFAHLEALIVNCIITAITSGKNKIFVPLEGHLGEVCLGGLKKDLIR